MGSSGKGVKFLVFLIIIAAVGAGVFFGMGKMNEKNVTDESTWTTISEPQFSIKVPKSMKKGEMLTVQGSSVQQLCFYTSQLAGFDVNFYTYNDEEKGTLGSLSVKEYETVMKKMTRKVNGQVLTYKARDGKNYLFAEYNRHSPNYIGKSDEVWYIEAMYPTKEGYYIVDTYCAQTDKDMLRESMLKWLDSFTIK